jgi:hypothetical protein
MKQSHAERRMCVAMGVLGTLRVMRMNMRVGLGAVFMVVGVNPFREGFPESPGPKGDEHEPHGSFAPQGQGVEIEQAPEKEDDGCDHGNACAVTQPPKETDPGRSVTIRDGERRDGC